MSFRAEAAERELAWESAGDYLSLTKPGITMMVVVTAGMGFLLAAGGQAAFDLFTLSQLLLGTALSASGASALNQVIERDLDKLMDRTRCRPLPAGRLSPKRALGFGVLLAAAGVLELTLFVNALTGLCSAFTVLAYLFVYTPLKTRTQLSTLVGAVPGAVPPIMGWTAARGQVETEAVVLFAILFLWQLPHFLAIAWMYREDYRRGGFPVLAVVDPGGQGTARQVVLYSLALIPVTLMPALMGRAGSLYFFVALGAGLLLLALSVRMARVMSRASARGVLFGSLVYLPVLLAAMLVDSLHRGL